MKPYRGKLKAAVLDTSMPTANDIRAKLLQAEQVKLDPKHQRAQLLARLNLNIHEAVGAQLVGLKTLKRELLQIDQPDLPTIWRFEHARIELIAGVAA